MFIRVHLWTVFSFQNSFNTVLQFNPDNASFLFYRGSAHGQLGEYQKAIADLNEAIRLNPDYANAYFNRGLVYEKMGDIGKAIDDFQQAADLDRQQGNIKYSQEALDKIRQLEQ